MSNYTLAMLGSVASLGLALSIAALDIYRMKSHDLIEEERDDEETF